MLKQHRRRMKPGIRKKTRKYRGPKKWLYPRAAERVYSSRIKEVITLIFNKINTLIGHKFSNYVPVKKDSRQDQTPIQFQVTASEIAELLEEVSLQTGQSIRALISQTGIDVSTANDKEFGKFSEKLFGVNFVPIATWEKEAIAKWAETNFELIKSVSNTSIKKINSILEQGIVNGKTYDEMKREIMVAEESITESKANLIARDQVGKLNSELIQRRMTEAGIDMYKWSTSLDERVRGNPSGKYPDAKPSHFLMQDILCRWDDVTVYSDDNGETWIKRIEDMPIAHPGDEIQCRCTALPYFDEMLKLIDEEIEK